ncbi:MAG: hypothetical protein PHF56_12980 [Desulfuromonadaceae bacterium]|nr:hypothetical protein [Desulfuromonadaceae bacterium]
MIEEFTVNLAKQRGITLTSVSLADGKMMGCQDVYILEISSKGRLVSKLVHHSDINKLQNDSACDRLEVIIRSALTKLAMLLDNKKYLLGIEATG